MPPDGLGDVGGAGSHLIRSHVPMPPDMLCGRGFGLGGGGVGGAATGADAAGDGAGTVTTTTRGALDRCADRVGTTVTAGAATALLGIGAGAATIAGADGATGAMVTDESVEVNCSMARLPTTASALARAALRAH